MSLIKIEGLIGGYGKLPVVREIDLVVEEGEVVCLLGANGAGKTTTLLTVAGVLPLISGSVEVLGEQVRPKPHIVARSGLAFVPEDRGIFFRLTVADNLALRKHKNSKVKIDHIVDLFPALGPLMSRRAGLLSGGEQQMLALAGAVISDPKVILLDEMSLGLAPLIVKDLLRMVREMADSSGTGVLLVEQHVRAALDVSDRGYVLEHGRIVAEGSAARLEEEAEMLQASYLGQS